MSDSRSSSQEDLPRIRLHDSYFSSSFKFRLFCLMSLIGCEFNVITLYLYIEKSLIEPEITEETLRNFNSRDNQNRIEIIQTNIDLYFMFIFINNAERRLKMENVELNVINIQIGIGEKGHDCQTVSVFELEMINCRMRPSITLLHLRSPNSFGTFRFENTVFERISFFSQEHAGLASYVFDNCTFMHAFYFDIQKFVDFKILRSSFFLPNDCDGRECNVHLTGIDHLNLMSDKDLSKMYFLTSRP